MPTLKKASPSSLPSGKGSDGTVVIRVGGRLGKLQHFDQDNAARSVGVRVRKLQLIDQDER